MILGRLATSAEDGTRYCTPREISQSDFDPSNAANRKSLGRLMPNRSAHENWASDLGFLALMPNGEPVVRAPQLMTRIHSASNFLICSSMKNHISGLRMKTFTFNSVSRSSAASLIWS